MKRTTWVTAAVCMGLSLLLSGFNWGRKKEEAAEPPQAAQSAQAEETAAAPSVAIGETVQLGDTSGKVVYKFEGEEDMREFAGLWQQRRGLLTRMAVLRAYVSEEQARLQELDSQFEQEFSVDTSKKFVLDSDRGLLVELEEAETGEAAGGDAEAVPAQGAE